MSKIAGHSVLAAIVCASAGLAHADAAMSPGTLADAMIGEDSASFWLSQRAHVAALTRKQVRAELLSPEPAPPEVASTLTRAGVRAEVIRARSSGECTVIGEDSGAGFLAQRRVAAGLRYAGPNIGKDEPHKANGG